MKITFLKTFAFVFLLSFLVQTVSPAQVFAADEDNNDDIIVRWNDKNGDEIDGDEMFDADNIYPGWSQSKTIYVKNNNTEEDAKIYFVLDSSGDEDLAKELKLYVTRLGDNKSVRIGGSGDRYNLDSADEKNLFLDELSMDSGKQYRIKIKFDENAGNALQNHSMSFDVEFKIEGVIESGTEARILAEQNRPVILEGLTDEEVEAAEVEVLGENTPTVSDSGAETDSKGTVMGISKDCKNTNKNPWLIALAVLATVIAINGWRDNQGKGYGWKLDTLAVGILLLGWYCLETCHLLRWVPISAILIGIIFHIFSPYVFEKKEGIK